MKTHRNFLIVIAFIITAIASMAMEIKPRWLSDKGWWVVESNINTPRHYIIHFYNLDGVEVYREQLDGVRLRIHRTKTKMHLRQVLESSVTAWERQHTMRRNEALVISRLKRK